MFAVGAGFVAHTYGMDGMQVPGVEPISAHELGDVDCVVMPNVFAGKDYEALGLFDELREGVSLMMFGVRGVPHWVYERFRLVDLLADESLVLANAEMTAEGAIYCAMRRVKFAIAGARCLIIGFGRIGYALNERLVALGAEVCVAARREEIARKAVQRGARGQSMEEMVALLGEQKLIFSTPPERVLGEAELRVVRKDALVIDLSSAPFGVDFAAAKRLGRNVRLEAALPGRYCPESAGCAMWTAVQAAMEEGEAADEKDD